MGVRGLQTMMNTTAIECDHTTVTIGTCTVSLHVRLGVLVRAIPVSMDKQTSQRNSGHSMRKQVTQVVEVASWGRKLHQHCLGTLSYPAPTGVHRDPEALSLLAQAAPQELQDVITVGLSLLDQGLEEEATDERTC